MAVGFATASYVDVDVVVDVVAIGTVSL